MSEYTFSVIIPAHNEEKYIGKCLEAIKEAEKAAIRKKTEDLEKYIEVNEDKFIEVKDANEIPAEFEQFASFDKIIEYGRYDDAEAMRYVCNQDYTMLYKYHVHLSWAKPGAYWGD